MFILCLLNAKREAKIVHGSDVLLRQALYFGTRFGETEQLYGDLPKGKTMADVEGFVEETWHPESIVIQEWKVQS